MKTKSATQVYEVQIVYSVEAEDSIKAFDKVLSMSPLKPISYNVEIVTELEEEDE